MREFPWIKDVRIDSKDFDNYNYVIFLNLFIDPYELGNEYGFTVARWTESAIRNNQDYPSTLISMYYNGSTDEMRDITIRVNETIEMTQMSPAIPQDLRLPIKKSFMVGSYHLTDNITIPINIEETY